MSFTMNDVALLAIALLVGLLLGLMMSGRGKYRRLWRDEQIAHRQTIKDRDIRIATAEARVSELERQSGPVGPGTATAVAAATHGRDDLSQAGGVSASSRRSL